MKQAMAGLLVSAHLCHIFCIFNCARVCVYVCARVPVRVCITGMHACGDTGQCCVSSSVPLISSFDGSLSDPGAHWQARLAG